MVTCTFEDGGKAALRHTVVHALVIKDGKILLVMRSEKIIEGGKWGFPGGYINRDETAKQAVIRELKEETGWDGEVIDLFRVNSNPDRGNDNERQNIVLEFLIRPIEKTGEKDWEQTEIQWFEIADAMNFDLAFDHNLTLELVKSYLDGEVSIPLVV